VLGPRVGDPALGLEEVLDAAGADVAERVVLEERPHVEPQIVAVVVLGPLRDVAELQIGEPEVGEVGEGAGQAEDSPAAVAGAIQQPPLEQRLGTLLRRRGRGHLPEPAVQVAVPGAGPVPAADVVDRDLAERAEDGSGSPAGHRAPPGR